MTRNRGKRFVEDEMDKDGSLQEGNPHARRRRKKSRIFHIPRWVYRVIAILVLCVLVLLIWFNRENLTPQNIVEWVQTQVVGMGVGDGYPAKLAGSTVSPGNFASVDKDVVYVSDTRLTVLNSTAKELVSRQHSYSSPVMRAAGTRVLIYNLGGNGYQIESRSKTIAVKSAANNILAGDIAANGKYALVTEEKGYCSMLTVYLADHTEQYRFEFADYYVTDISLNRDGTKAAVTGLSASGGAMVSAVYLFDFSQPKETAKFTYEECLMFGAAYSEDGSVFAVGDSLASVVKPGGKEKVDYSYGSQRLTDYTVDNGRLALALSPYADSESGVLVLLDSTGKELHTIQCSAKIESVSLFGETVAVLSGGIVQGYTVTTGIASGSCGAGNDAKAVALHDESSVYILGVNEVRLEDLK